MLNELLKLINKTTPSSICDIKAPIGDIIREEGDTLYIWYKAMIFKNKFVNGTVDDEILDGVNKIVKSKSGKPSLQSITIELLPNDTKYSSCLNVLLQYKKSDIVTLEDRVKRPSMRTLLGLNK